MMGGEGGEAKRRAASGQEVLGPKEVRWDLPGTHLKVTLVSNPLLWLLQSYDAHWSYE